jgi:hypothetical protein
MGAKVLKNVVNLDAGESIFFARELQHIKAKTYDVEYPELRARQLIPVSMEAGEGAQFIVYRQYDMVGQAKIVANYSRDLPRVDLRAKEFIANIRSIGDSYGYSLQDIRSARTAGIPLDQRKANAAKRASYQLEDAIALSGDTDNNLGGFISHPNLTDVAAPNGTSGHSDWARKTNTEILADLNTLATTAPVATLDIEQPDTIIMPLAQYSQISTLQMPNIDKTVKQFFLENNLYIKNIEVWTKFTGAGAGGTDLAMSYKKSPEKVTLEVPVDFEQMPVQEIGLEYEVPCHMRCGGVIWYYPLSGTKMHGV